VITLDNSRDEATAPNARERERRARAPSAGSHAAPILAPQRTGARGPAQQCRRDGVPLNTPCAVVPCGE
jgi:hypothetical protein